MRSVRELAREVACDETTLQYHWRSEVCSARHLTLGAFLDWVLLLRARQCTKPQEKTASGADRIGIAALRIDHISLRATSLRLAEHDMRGWVVTVHLFNDVLSSVLGQTPAQGIALGLGGPMEGDGTSKVLNA